MVKVNFMFAKFCHIRSLYMYVGECLPSQRLQLFGKIFFASFVSSSLTFCLNLSLDRHENKRNKTFSKHWPLPQTHIQYIFSSPSSSTFVLCSPTVTRSPFAIAFLFVSWRSVARLMELLQPPDQPYLELSAPTDAPLMFLLFQHLVVAQISRNGLG